MDKVGKSDGCLNPPRSGEELERRTLKPTKNPSSSHPNQVPIKLARGIRTSPRFVPSCLCARTLDDAFSATRIVFDRTKAQRHEDACSTKTDLETIIADLQPHRKPFKFTPKSSFQNKITLPQAPPKNAASSAPLRELIFLTQRHRVPQREKSHPHYQFHRFIMRKSQ